MNTSIAVPHHPSLITWMATECLKGGVHWPMACHLLGQDGAGWSRMAREGPGFRYTTQSGVQFKTCELFISGIFHVIFSNCG